MNKIPFLPFEDFLQYLQQQGFALGIDDFLQVQTLLNQLPEGCTPERLRGLLAPLLVSDEDEQEFFYRAFDQYFADLNTQHQILERQTTPQSTAMQKMEAELEQYHKYGEELEYSFKGFFYNNFSKIAIAFLVLLVLGIGGTVLWNSWKEEPHRESVETISSTQQKPFGNENGNENTKEKNLPIAKEESPSNSIPPIIEKKKESTTSTTSPSSNEEKIAISKQNPSAPFSYLSWLWIACFFLFFGGGLWFWFVQNRKTFYIQAIENIRPPRYWNIQVPKSELNFTRTKTFKNAATHLNTRQTIPTSHINVAKTIDATIAAAGYPTFEYLQRGELPEYLLLIDQSSVKDQQARWFEMWFEGLKKQEVLVNRYFFHHNTEWCWDAEKHSISLKELQHRFGDCRLVIIAEVGVEVDKWEFSEMDSQLSPNLKGVGEISNLSEVFFDWREKALLSTRNLTKLEVETLEEESGFVVLPARLEGLNQLAQVFEGEKIGGGKAKRSFENIGGGAAIVDWRGIEHLSAKEALKELKQKLNQVSFRWLCGSAVYPEMNWDLTVYIGETLLDERELLKEENVLPLVSLPWFRKGFLPEELRRLLLEELEGNDKRLVKEAILHLLQLHPLVGEEYSAEFLDYQLHIALEDAQLHPQDQYKLKALKHLTQQKEFEKSRYKQVVLRYMKMANKGLTLEQLLGKQFKEKDSTKARKAEQENLQSPTSQLEEATANNSLLYPPAPSIERLAALILDIFTAASITGIFAFLFWKATGVDLLTTYLSNGILFSMMFLGMELSLREATMGKGLMNLCLMDLDTGLPPTVFQVFLRRAFDLVLLLFLSVGLDMELEARAIFSVLLTIAIVDFWRAVQPEKEGNGRRIGDFIAGTQVVNVENYENGTFSKVEPPKEYVYPKADVSKRVNAAQVDIFFGFFCCVFVAPVVGGLVGMILYGMDFFPETSLGTLIWVCGAIFIVFFCSYLDNWNKRTGLGKTTNLRIVNIRTGELSSGLENFWRRFNDFIPLLFCFWLFQQIHFTLVWEVLFGLFFAMVLGLYAMFNYKLIQIGNGRRTVDFLLDTQVVNREDFETGNFTVRPKVRKSLLKQWHLWIEQLKPSKRERGHFQPLRVAAVKQNALNSWQELLEKRRAKYSYPLVDESARMGIFFAENAAILVACLLIYILGSAMQSIWVPKILVLSLLLLTTLRDSWQHFLGFKNIFPLMVVNVRTNKRCNWQQSLIRHLPTAVLFYIFSWNIYRGNWVGNPLHAIIIISILSFYIINFFLVLGDGKGIMDKLLGIQVINVKDYEEENFEMAKQIVSEE